VSQPASRRRAVIVMAKRPAAGSTKTRLAPALSLESAAELYERFLLDTIHMISSRTDCTTVIAIEDASSADYFTSIAPGVAQVLQLGDSLGPRLDSVLRSCLADGLEQVVAIGSDSPDLPSSHIDEAFDMLDQGEVDVVLGPTDDGGYYLIGWKQPWSPMVVEVEMSTAAVLTDTLAVAERVGARCALAPTWYDVDEPADLARLRSSSTLTQAVHTADLLKAL